VRKCIDQYQLEPLIRGLDIPFIVQEIGMLKRLGMSSLDEYLMLERAGMKIGLRKAQRKGIWRVFEDVRYEASGVADFDDYPRLALQALRDDTGFTGYQAVIVDEAQDSSPMMAKLAFAMVSGEQRRLMVLADPAQAIYPNGFYLARREFAPHGVQSIPLRVPYRSTRQIHACAMSLFDNAPDLRSDMPELRDAPRHGPLPHVEISASVAEAEAALVAAIGAELADHDRRPEEIAVLFTSKRGRVRIQHLLEEAGIPLSVIDGFAPEAGNRRDMNLDFPAVKLLTVHAAKGLDFPSVYVFSFEARVGESEAENRSLLYVALTRSSFSLTVISAKQALSPLLQDLAEGTFTLSGTASGLLAR
jgi:superfamily I DNA/RNA helicase